ncbi:MAG: hypothetical protein PHU25_05640 [Deltaproteobacteria bacterium]|nr:hypothetical protein [Deltaproteobacteria bacterium]
MLQIGCSPDPACENANDFPSGDNTSFLSVQFYSEWGGPCANLEKCWDRMGLDADGTLVLADGDGNEIFEVTDEELDEVRDIADRKETWDYVSQTICPGPLASWESMEIVLKNGDVYHSISGYSITGCLTPDTPMGELYYMIAKMRDRYFSPRCTEYRYDVDSEGVWTVDEKSRGLCT